MSKKRKPRMWFSDLHKGLRSASPPHQGSSQKSLVIKIFAVGHLKIVDFPALTKNDKLLSFLQKSDAYFSPLKVFAIRSTFWGPRDCRNSTRKSYFFLRFCSAKSELIIPQIPRKSLIFYYENVFAP